MPIFADQIVAVIHPICRITVNERSADLRICGHDAEASMDDAVLGFRVATVPMFAVVALSNCILPSSCYTINML